MTLLRYTGGADARTLSKGDKVKKDDSEHEVEEDLRWDKDNDFLVEVEDEELAEAIVASVSSIKKATKAQEERVAESSSDADDVPESAEAGEGALDTGLDRAAPVPGASSSGTARGTSGTRSNR